MHTADLILLLIGFVCFFLAAIGTAPEKPRINLVAVGLACWILVPLIATLNASS